MDKRNIPLECEVLKTDETRLERLRKYYNMLKNETELKEKKND